MRSPRTHSRATENDSQLPRENPADGLKAGVRRRHETLRIIAVTRTIVFWRRWRNRVERLHTAEVHSSSLCAPTVFAAVSTDRARAQTLRWITPRASTVVLIGLVVLRVFAIRRCVR